MEKPLKDRMVDSSQKDIIKPSATDYVKHVVATLFGWNKTTPVSETFENIVNESSVNPSPHKQYEKSVSDSLHRYHDFYRKHMPYNQRV
jgi:hypothetical protein